MFRTSFWLIALAPVVYGCSSGGNNATPEQTTTSACEVSNYCVMLSGSECDDRGGDALEDYDCDDLGFECQDDDRHYAPDDPDCPEFVPDTEGLCLTDTGGANRCAVSIESDCSGDFDDSSSSCDEVDYPWQCNDTDSDGAQYELAIACTLSCSDECDYLGDQSDLQYGACESSLLLSGGCLDLPESECEGSFTADTTCADAGFDWLCSEGTAFQSESDCLLGCSGGCQGDEPITPIGDPEDGVPAGGGVLAVDIGDRTTLTLEFEMDVFVIDNDGDIVTGLQDSDLFFEDAVFDWIDVPDAEDPFFSFTQNCFETMETPDYGPYSAVMLMDQSGSITSTDPGDTRIDAAKIFFGALGPDDEAILAAFASAGSLSSDFVHWGDFEMQYDFDSTLDMLASLEGGGTPLFDATVVYTDKVAAEGNNSNKAVVVFTDGDDTESNNSLAFAVENASEKGIKIFTVGLSDGVDRGVLQQLAFGTGGSMMYTADAANLVALYGTLGNLLSGGVAYYHTCWTVERDKQDFSEGNFNTSLRVARPGGGYAYVPVHIEY